MNTKKILVVSMLTISIGAGMAPANQAFAETRVDGSIGLNVGSILMGAFHKKTPNAKDVGIGQGPQAILPGSLPGSRENEEDPYYQAGNLAIVQGDNGYGLVDINGKMVISADAKNIKPLYNGNLAVTYKDSKTPVYVKNAQVPATGDFAGRTTNPDNLYSFKDKQTKKFGFKNAEGQVVIAPQFKDVLTEFSEDRAFVQLKDGEKAAINSQGDVVFTTKFDGFGKYQDGVAEVRRKVAKLGIGTIVGRYFGDSGHGSYTSYEASTYDNVKRGYIDKNGVTVIDSKNDKVYPMTPYGAFVENDGRLGLINHEGEFVIAPGKYTPKGVNLTYGWAALQNKDNNLIGVFDMKTGKEILPFAYKKVSFLTHGLVATQIGDKDIVISKLENHDKSIFTMEPTTWISNYGDKGNMWIKGAVRGSMQGNGDGYKIVDLEGKVLFNAKEINIEKVGMFKHGVSPVRVDGKWGLMNAQGNWVLQPEYKSIQIL